MLSPFLQGHLGHHETSLKSLQCNVFQAFIAEKEGYIILNSFEFLISQVEKISSYHIELISIYCMYTFEDKYVLIIRLICLLQSVDHNTRLQIYFSKACNLDLRTVSNILKTKLSPQTFGCD